MYFRALSWTINDVVGKYSTIDPQPQYQRGLVWDDKRKRLLIDTILNGYDIPKIYLRHVNQTYLYEVADGQQRLKAIVGFTQDEYELGSIEGVHAQLSGLKYSKLSAVAKKIIDDYELSISVAYGATNDQIREVFRRLQLGVRLTPAELRNSLPSAIGDLIRAVASNHTFFKNCSFPSARFKHDEFAAIAFLLACKGSEVDIKAPDILSIYKEYEVGAPSGTAARVNKALKLLNEMQVSIPDLITRKWAYVDLVNWALHSVKRPVTAALLAQKYSMLEASRLSNGGNPERLLEGKASKANQDLYDYIKYFRLEAATKKSVARRLQIVTAALAS